MRPIRHFVAPHHHNNFRALLLHHHVLVLYLFFLALFNLSLFIPQKISRFQNILGLSTEISTDKLLYFTNLERIQRGLKPLTLNSKLTEAAYLKATDMFNFNYWAHNSPIGKTPWSFILRTGYGYQFAGENLARDFQTSKDIVGAWIESPTHRENLLSAKYDDIGFAVLAGKLNGKDTTLVVQIFGTATKNLATSPQEKPQPSISSLKNPIVPQETAISKILSKTVEIKPKLDIFAFKKELSLAFTIYLIALLLIDATYMYREKAIFRINGHSLTHISFFIAVLTMIFLMKKGTII